MQQAVRWNVFQLAQATWRVEGTGVPAKGLTGGAYDGHYFWDTEAYVLPFLAYTQPRTARNLLRFRHSMLPKARERAAVLGQRGATFERVSENEHVRDTVDSVLRAATYARQSKAREDDSVAPRSSPWAWCLAATA